MKTDDTGLLQQRYMTPELATAVTEKLLTGLMNKSQTEEIQDDRYALVVSRKQSRFLSSLGEDPVLSLEIDPSGRSVAYSRADGSLTIWLITGPSFARSKKIYITEVAGPDKCVSSLSWNCDEINQFATVFNSSEIFIWAIDERKKNASKVRTLSVGAKVKLSKCLYDPTGRWLVTLAKSDELHLFDVKKDFELQTMLELNQIIPDDSIQTVNWNNLGSHLFLGLKSGRLAVLEVGETFKLCICLQAQQGTITSVAVDPWGRFVVTGSTDGTCAVWDLSSMCCSLLIADVNSSVVSLDIDHSGKVLAICTEKGELQLRDIDTGKPLLEHQAKLGGPDIVAKFYPDKAWMISSVKGDLLQNHSTPGTYDSITGLWKVEYEKAITGSRIKAPANKPVRKNQNHNHERNRVTKRDQPRNGRFSGRR